MRELGRRGERLSVKEEGRGGGGELGSDLDLDPDSEKLCGSFGSGSGSATLLPATFSMNVQ